MNGELPGSGSPMPDAPHKKEPWLEGDKLDALKALSINKDSLLKLMDTAKIPRVAEDFPGAATQGFYHLREYPNRLALLRQTRIPPTRDFAVTALASDIAHSRDPDSPLFHPTADQIRADLRRTLSGWFFIDVLKPLSTKLNGVMERKGAEIVNKYSRQAREWIEIFGKTPKPKLQLVGEVVQLYDTLTDPELPTDPVNAVALLKGQLPRTRYASEYETSKDAVNGSFLNAKDFPLLVSVLRKLNPELVYKLSQKPVHLATREILEAMGQFLTERGVEHRPVPKMPASLKGIIAHQLKPDTFQTVRRDMSVVLGAVYDLLPENGPDFVDRFYKLSEDIVEAKKQGHSDSEITKRVFASVDEGEAPYDRDTRLWKNPYQA
ncbi:MAG TPA: hypothetical protein VLE91_01100 [Candidatus Saccharimonadales bacterium]|nr:hypothetical protein [Candidatus Saccharimonadales bacterium]